MTTETEPSVIFHFSSTKLATKVMKKVCRIQGNGGQSCFKLEECPIGSKPGRKVIRLMFLPGEFKKVATKNGWMKYCTPNKDILMGWVQGYLAGQKG